MTDLLAYFQAEMIAADWTAGDAGTYDASGAWVPAAGATVSIDIIAPQPVTANELQMLEDGEHVRDYLKTWTTDPVATRRGVKEADTLAFNGRTYKVMQVDNRDTLGEYQRLVIREITADD